MANCYPALFRSWLRLWWYFGFEVGFAGPQSPQLKRWAAEYTLMSAKFQADATFIIIGRGLVLSGWIIEGTVKQNMVISIPSFPRILKIETVEMIRATNHLPGLVGLVFSFVDDHDTALWKQLDVKGKVFEIEDRNP